jgi:2,3-bisphosphoglycerate-independent phosphoglycerate mutase
MNEKMVLFIMDSIAPGVRPGSDVAHLALLGYDPYEVYTGRGPFEAAGVGIDLQEGDVALRCNFATVENNIVIDRRAGRIDAKEIARSMDEVGNIDDVEIIFKESIGHRAALVLRGEGLSTNVTSNDPKKEGCEIERIEATRQDGKPPANSILVRGVGVAPSLENIEHKYGLSSAVVAAAGLVIGICKVCGMTYIESEGATGDIHSDVQKKVENAIRSLENYDFVLVNIKGTDEAGHDGDFDLKTEFISKIDESLGDVLELSDTLVVVTADYSTPVSVRDHSADPVPIAIRGEGIRVDDVDRYDEISAAHGGLLRISSRNVIPILMDLLGKTSEFGA